MAAAGVVATLLPAAAFYLKLGRFAPARMLIEHDVAVALATDVNPGGGFSSLHAVCDDARLFRYGHDARGSAGRRHDQRRGVTRPRRSHRESGIRQANGCRGHRRRPWPTWFASARRSFVMSSRRVGSHMSKFVDQPLSGFLDALASPEPTPGGGTAAAIAGAMGVSLLMMVSGLVEISRRCRSRTRCPVRSAGGARKPPRPLGGPRRCRRRRLQPGHGRVSSAKKHGSGKERQERRHPAGAQGRDASRRSTRCALPVRLCVLRRVVAQHGNRSATSDVGVGIGLLEAAAKGAAANVRINLGSLLDEAFKASASADVDALQKQSSEDAAAANAALET